MTENPNEWLTKFIACWIVVAVSLLHYRLVNIGIIANDLLALGKVAFLGILIVAGFVGVCRDGNSGNLRGIHDYVQTFGNVTPTNIILAILLVLFSYQGWENASTSYGCAFFSKWSLINRRLCHIRDQGRCREPQTDPETRSS
jgi:amino acid transporter